jgi:hypothetical protein
VPGRRPGHPGRRLKFPGQRSGPPGCSSRQPRRRGRQPRRSFAGSTSVVGTSRGQTGTPPPSLRPVRPAVQGLRPPLWKRREPRSRWTLQSRLTSLPQHASWGWSPSRLAPLLQLSRLTPLPHVEGYKPPIRGSRRPTTGHKKRAACAARFLRTLAMSRRLNARKVG